MTGNRVKWLDYAKGIGLLFVIIGHCITLDIRGTHDVALKIYEVIYYFHMPLMFYISGRTFSLTLKKHSNTSVLVYTKNKFKGYLVPYFAYGVTVKLLFVLILFIPAANAVMNSTSFSSEKSFLVGLITANNPLSLHLWYLYVLFIMSIVSFIAFKCIGEKEILYKSLMMIFAIIIYYERTGKLYDKWFGIYMFMQMFFWFCLGGIIDASKANLVLMLVIMIIVKTVQIVGGDIRVINDAFRVVSVFFIIVVITKICALFGERDSFSKLRKLGQNSMGFYLFHQPFCATAISTLVYKFAENWILATLCGFITSLLIPYIIIYVANKYNLSLVQTLYLGKNMRKSKQ